MAMRLGALSLDDIEHLPFAEYEWVRAQLVAEQRR